MYKTIYILFYYASPSIEHSASRRAYVSTGIHLHLRISAKLLLLISVVYFIMVIL